MLIDFILFSNWQFVVGNLFNLLITFIIFLTNVFLFLCAGFCISSNFIKISVFSKLKFWKLKTNRYLYYSIPNGTRLVKMTKLIYAMYWEKRILKQHEKPCTIYFHKFQFTRFHFVPHTLYRVNCIYCNKNNVHGNNLPRIIVSVI
jgi:hypothetical protein